MRGRGGYVGFNRVPTAGAASGVWTLREAEEATRAGTWPKMSVIVQYLIIAGGGSGAVGSRGGAGGAG
ncbi:hypothetical protein EB118_22555, partial [bacterium]|nr:hypothetical protein [bacterium]